MRLIGLARKGDFATFHTTPISGSGVEADGETGPSLMSSLKSAAAGRSVIMQILTIHALQPLFSLCELQVFA